MNKLKFNPKFTLMNRHLKLAAVALAALLASCAQDVQDAVVPTAQVSDQELDAVVNRELLLSAPATRAAGVEYAWYLDGECVSTSPEYRYLPTEACDREIVLKTTVNGIESVTNYKVSSYISLANELSNFTLDASNGTRVQKVGYIWNKTYSAEKFATENFTFSHTGGEVTGYAYWDGWTVSTVSDTTNYGAPGSSDSWIPNQWGCMAEYGSTPAEPYMVGYWGYYVLDWQHPIETSTFDEANYSNWVKLGNDDATHKINSITLGIAPWPYFGCLYGDGFARPFVEGDYFGLKIWGIDANKQAVGPVNYNQIWHNGVLDYKKGWDTIDANTLRVPFKNRPIKYLVFQIVTTDNDPMYGPNSAAYFCVKDIQYQ